MRRKLIPKRRHSVEPSRSLWMGSSTPPSRIAASSSRPKVGSAMQICYEHEAVDVFLSVPLAMQNCGPKPAQRAARSRLLSLISDVAQTGTKLMPVNDSICQNHHK